MPKLAILPLLKYTGYGTVNTSGTKVFTPEENKYFEKFNLHIYISLPTLKSPTLTLHNKNLTITNGLGNGKFIPDKYKITWKDGIQLTEINGASSTTVDLSTLITEEGTFVLSAKAIKNSFRDSYASNSIVYTNEQPPYTVTINEIRGTSGLGWTAYDGTGQEGQYLREFSNESSLPISLQINSGHLYLECEGSTTGGDTSTNLIIVNTDITDNPVGLTYDVKGSGTIEYISATRIE